MLIYTLSRSDKHIRRFLSSVNSGKAAKVTVSLRRAAKKKPLGPSESLGRIKMPGQERKERKCPAAGLANQFLRHESGWQHPDSESCAAYAKIAHRDLMDFAVFVDDRFSSLGREAFQAGG